MATLLPMGRQKFDNSAGLPLVGGKLFTFDAGTNTPRPTFADAAGLIPNVNPVILDARGEALLFWAGAYKVILKDAADVTIWTVDNVSGVDATQLLSIAGAGLIGFAQAPPYPQNSLGFWAQKFAGPTGAESVGWSQHGTGAVLSNVQQKLQEQVSVFDFMTQAQITDVQNYAYTLNTSAAIFAAQTAARAKGAAVFFPGGGYLASIAVRYNNAALIGAGANVTRIRLPATAVPITGIVRNTTTVMTVTCAAAHDAWVGKGYSIAGSATSHLNIPVIVTAVVSATVFTAQSLAFTGPTGSYGSANLYEAMVIDAGAATDGNSAQPYSGLTIRGFTLDGNRTARTPNPTDTTDWGLLLTAFSDYHISDLRAVDCRAVGAGAVINSNFGYFQAEVENCGGTLYPGFDINSSKHLTLDVVSKNCAYGARVLDNTWGVLGRFTIFNATFIGFIHQNQPVNESHSNDLTVSVYTCGANGVVIGENCRNSKFNITVVNAAENGLVLVESSKPANRPSANVIDLSTRLSGMSGLLCYGNANQIRHVSSLDGRAGPAASSYASDIYGDGNLLSASIIDGTIPQVRTIALRGALSILPSVANFLVVSGVASITFSSPHGRRTGDTILASGFTPIAWNSNLVVTYVNELTLNVAALSTQPSVIGVLKNASTDNRVFALYTRNCVGAPNTVDDNGQRNLLAFSSSGSGGGVSNFADLNDRVVADIAGINDSVRLGLLKSVDVYTAPIAVGRTLTAADLGKTLLTSGNAIMNFVIPLDSVLGVTGLSVIKKFQAGSGLTSFTPDSANGVVLLNPNGIASGPSAITAIQWASLNTWVLLG